MKMFSLRYQVDGQIFILSLYDISSDEQKNRRCNSVVEILVSSLDVITIQIIIDSAPSQLFKAIGTAFACLSSSVSVEEYTIRRLTLNCSSKLCGCQRSIELHPFKGYKIYFTRSNKTRLFSTYLHITRSKIIESMTFARETLPQIVRSEDPANFLGVARWKEFLDSKPINQYHVLQDRKSGNVMGREEVNFRLVFKYLDKLFSFFCILSTSSKTSAMLLGNTIYYRAGITSKIFPFETSSSSLPFPFTKLRSNGGMEVEKIYLQRIKAS
ncbi:hypothetical protein V1477_001515, partial [Vespula maculifrons]